MNLTGWPEVLLATSENILGKKKRQGQSSTPAKTYKNNIKYMPNCINSKEINSIILSFQENTYIYIYVYIYVYIYTYTHNRNISQHIITTKLSIQFIQFPLLASSHIIASSSKVATKFWLGPSSLKPTWQHKAFNKRGYPQMDGL